MNGWGQIGDEGEDRPTHTDGKKRLTWIENVWREETRRRGSVRARPVSSRAVWIWRRINSETLIPQKLKVVLNNMMRTFCTSRLTKWEQSQNPDCFSASGRFYERTQRTGSIVQTQTFILNTVTSCSTPVRAAAMCWLTEQRWSGSDCNTTDNIQLIKNNELRGLNLLQPSDPLRSPLCSSDKDISYNYI